MKIVKAGNISIMSDGKVTVSKFTFDPEGEDISHDEAATEALLWAIGILTAEVAVIADVEEGTTK